jgi:NAD(P)-dependent dehydrogenase (short-subunit alcohol dehydrogenase family)
MGRMPTFSATSTTDDVLEGVDLTGRSVLITGNSAGLGVEATRALTAHGAQVIGGVRDLERARTNLAAAGVDLDQVDLHELDLASLASARAFADSVTATAPTLDAIIANAGIMACPFGHTADGFELQFGTNHLGHFVAVNRVLPLLRDGGRVVTLSSSGHRFSNVDLDDPNFEHTPYDAWAAYGRAKTANVLFAVELDRRLRGRGTRATSLHPGGIVTELGRHLTDETMGQLIAAREGHDTTWKTVPQGAATEVWAAVVADGDTVGGRFCEDCDVASINDGSDAPNGVRSYALDPDTARALWSLSEMMVGESFPET